MKEEIILALITWISANTTYDVDFPQPNIVMTTQHNMCELYGISDYGQCKMSGLAGFYDKGLTIYLGTDFDPENPHYVSNLLHELTHYIQYQNHEHDQTCLGHLELEAYAVQDSWREKQGLKPTLDVFRQILLEDSCSA